MSDEQRLARIESKLDTLSDAVVALARIEERMVTLFRRMDYLDSRQDQNNDRLTEVEKHVGTNGHTLRFAERLFWIIATAGVGYLFWTLKNGG